ncbi:hypothetical protein [Roseibacillus persicicus]|uniref:hypothetical protein n=1 Tax=Roseibacillus persicicus TaxID=454148 RepID=UPI0016784B45|nr:hypothetical protein [Roseibacillus persicicus]MDQ8192222.1 hypothetical protein [Roseibacillus persicicus]
MKIFDREQQVALRVGSMILLGFAGFIVFIWVCGYLPGTIGRTFSLITGFLWTPLIMEPTLALMALMIILVLNHHRRKKEGPELVYLETVDGPEAKQLPPHSRSAAFSEEPQPPSGDEMVATIEGMMAVGDQKEAQRLMLELPSDLLESEEIVAVRLQMAQANSDPNHIRGLSRKLRELNPDHPLLG